MRSALAVISVVVLAIHGVVFYDQLFARWQDHQADYFEQAAKLVRQPRGEGRPAPRAGPPSSRSSCAASGPSASTAARPATSRIDDPRFSEADQPLRTHPKIPGHKFETFGCTICHDGQGRAVDAEGGPRGRRGLAVAACCRRR